MRITNSFSLEPIERDSVIYVQWSAVMANMPSSDDAKTRDRWNRFASKRCAGKDGLGKYYDSKKHALKVIREFKEREDVRRSKGDGS
jgi:hypothetical protein